MVLAQLNAGYPVWIGVDAEHYSDKDRGIFDTDLYHYEETEGIPMELEKGQALPYCDSVITHALLLCGADVGDGRVRRWCVKNSFGDSVGQNGYAVMSPEWFDRYVYQVVIRKDIASTVLKKEISGTEPVSYLEAWDPLGCLAGGES